MTKTLIICYLLCYSFFSFGQISYDEIGSAKLNSTRRLKIKLPKNYDADSDLKYPLIIVFDGDYLFEPVSGQVDFQTYFDDMPGSIIVGIVQGEQRFYDGYTDEVTGLPIESGFRFHEFIAKELIPYLDANYKTSKFRVAVGHDLMGNFINSFLFQEQQVFQAYVSISPDFQGETQSQLPARLNYLNSDVFYYMATSDKDIRAIRNTVLDVNESINTLDNQNLTYYFDDFEGDSHYTLVTSAISRAFDKIFDIYKPLREKELKEKVLPFEGTLDDYITDRYKRIEKLFGIEKPITEQELEKIAKVAQEREDLESLYKIGKLSQKLHPESPQGTYYLALHADRLGKSKKASKLYEAALAMGDSNMIDRDFILSQVEKMNLATEDLEKEDEDEEN